MKGRNGYFRRSRLSEAKFRLIIRYFAHDLAASKLARAEWCKLPDDQSTVLQATNQKRPALWCLIAFSRRGWRRWILFWRPPCSGKRGRGAGG